MLKLVNKMMIENFMLTVMILKFNKMWQVYESSFLKLNTIEQDKKWKVQCQFSYMSFNYRKDLWGGDACCITHSLF